VTDIPYRSALIVGAGLGISASVARHFAALGVKVALAARNVQKLEPLIQGTGTLAFSADASDPNGDTVGGDLDVSFDLRPEEQLVLERRADLEDPRVDLVEIAAVGAGVDRHYPGAVVDGERRVVAFPG
jgi:NAD(P)-dependent dehydrogenase (short-subunit alcohol dehydrogenase family)